MSEDDNIDVNQVMHYTYQECQKQFYQFYASFKQNVPLPNMELMQPSIYLKPWLTQNVSQPVLMHFKQNAPGYLDLVKAQHHPDDGWISWAKKGVYNSSIDMIAAYGHLAISPINNVLKDICQKMPKETFDALNPSNLLLLSIHYPRVQRYFMQRVEQISTPYRYYCDFQGSFQQSIVNTKSAFKNVRGHSGELDSYKQFGSVIVDMAEQSIAAKIGVALALFTLFRTPQLHKRTQASFNYLFPKYTPIGLVGRAIPIRFIFSKPLARIHGNPVMSGVVISYLLAMSVARTLKDSLQLQQDYPEIYTNLQSYNREVVNAPLHLKYRETLKDIKKNNKLK
jgi:hypothetical protein